MLAHLDSNGNGLIEWEEIEHFMRKYHSSEAEIQKAHNEFGMFDESGDGAIDKKEFRKLYEHQMRRHMALQTAARVLVKGDYD